MSALLAAGLAVLAALALAPAALAYGTSTSWASASAGTPPGAWAGVAGAGSAGDGDAAATLTETDAAGLAAAVEPPGADFAASAAGWTATDNSGALCSVSSAWTGSDGVPAGSLRTSYATLLNLLGLLAACDSTWTSPSFAWTGGAPAAVDFRIDRMVDLNGLVSVADATWAVRLVDETVPGSRVLVTGAASSDSGWTTQTAAGLGPSDVVSGHTYHLEIDVAFGSLLSLASGFGVGFDDVRLTITPQDHRADGELLVAGVPAGSTRTLELRARTTGEPLEASVWNGSGWTSVGTVTATAPGWDVVSHGLSPSEVAGGTVRVRFADAGGAPDTAPDALSVEYLRVVATGGITVSGPTSVTLPAVALDGLSPKATTAVLGPLEVVDAGGAASGWALTATATAWELDGSPGTVLPDGAFTVAPAAPSTPDGSDMTGVAAGAGGALGPLAPVELMSAQPGGGIGTYRQSPSLELTVPVTAIHGVYRSVITLSAS